jgi:putative ABC transport system permease protein
MISSYLKLAIKVLGRNKFFTTVSLIGISFTLAVLMLFVAYYKNQFGTKAPLSQAESLVYLRQLEQQEIRQDTTWVVDSTQVNGEWIKDSTMQTNNNSNWTSMSGFGYDFLKSYFSLQKLTSAEKITILEKWSSYDIYSNNRKIAADAKHVDEYYFDIFNFILLEGRTLNKADIDQASLNIVITDELAEKYFGKKAGITGEKIEFDNKSFEVKGVVKKATVNNEFITGDVFLPITYTDIYKNNDGYFGSYAAVIQSKNQNPLATQSEIEGITAKIPFLDPSQSNGANFNYMKVHSYTHFQLNAMNFYYSKDPKESARYFIILSITLLSLFCAVPLLNLVNLNVSRILDRASEIGIRKAFGASKSTILNQIIFENVVLTLFGGILGFILSLGMMKYINDNQWFDNLILRMNFSIFLISVLITIIFGILSGYIPALKIAKSSIAQSLKDK